MDYKVDLIDYKNKMITCRLGFCKLKTDLHCLIGLDSTSKLNFKKLYCSRKKKEIREAYFIFVAAMIVHDIELR